MDAEVSRRLVAAAAQARTHAYAPYSSYAVGAAILTAGGRIFTGANVENASYPVGMCAERVALFSAVAAGERDFLAAAVVTRDGGRPCGACRQALAEFGLGMEIICADDTGVIRNTVQLSVLLPDAFSASSVS